MLKKIKDTLKALFGKKIIFFEKKKYKALIYDDGYSNLDLSQICEFLTIKNQIFIFSLLKAIFKSFLKFNFNKDKIIQNYLLEIIKKFKAKVIISHDLKKNIFNIKNDGLKKIIYQLADHEEINKEILKKDIILNNDSKSEIDYYLIKHKIFSQSLDFIKTNFITTGSIKNNEKKIERVAIKEFDIMIISQFRPNIYNFFGSYRPKMMFNSDSALWFVSKVTSDYCDINNKRLAIALASHREDKKKYNYKKNELKFYDSACKSYTTKNIDSYNLAEKSKLIITTYSSLGLELLARGKKVLFIDPFYFLGGNYINMFTLEKEGSHWLAGNDKDKIFEKIDSLLKLKEEEWEKIQKNSPFLIEFDQGNKKLKKLIKEIIN